MTLANSPPADFGPETGFPNSAKLEVECLHSLPNFKTYTC